MRIDKQHLIHQIKADWWRITGRQYQINLETLSIEDLRELIRLNYDINYEQRRVAAK
jgi:hypothetical protein